MRAALLGLLAVAPVLSACNDDGRTLRDPRPEQNASVSTLAPVTEPSDGVGGDVGGGLGFDTIAPTVPPQSPTLVAPFVDGGPIDARYTCDGENLAPALSWSAPPPGTVEVAITLTDLDAPDFVHWAMAGLDPTATAIGEATVPEFAITSVNSGATLGYTGPCPPAGTSHTYQFTVHFLLQQTELASDGPAADLLAAINDATFSQASVTGVYAKAAG